MEVEAFHVLRPFDDDGASGGLPDEADDLGVSRLAIDDELRVRFLVGHALDAALELQHDGAGGVDDVDVVLPRSGVGFGRFAVSAEQNFGVAQAAESVVVDGCQAERPQAVAFPAVVYDVAEAIEACPGSEFFLRLADGGGHAEAET